MGGRGLKPTDQRILLPDERFFEKRGFCNEVTKLKSQQRSRLRPTRFSAQSQPLNQ